MTTGGIIPRTGDINQTILEVFTKAWEKECFDALLIPVEIPSGDSYAYVFIQDTSLLKEASPLPPIISVQGGKVISSLTKHGNSPLSPLSGGENPYRIAAVMRPCEIRAGLELFKIGQADLENMLLISVDCPGALPLSDYVSNPEKGKEEYRRVLQKWGNEAIRPVCQTCLHFAAPVGDVHIGIAGDEKSIHLIPNSDKGQELLQSLDISKTENLDTWEDKVRDIRKTKEENKKKSEENMEAHVLGLDGLLETFSKCIACHNCMKACPICYCRLCYFESGDMKHEARDYLHRAEARGSLKFPADKLLFHSGRMSHISLSCVACGSCEDACPASIPVAQLFSFIADKNQALFKYLPGMNKEEMPLVVYKEEEFEEFED